MNAFAFPQTRTRTKQFGKGMGLRLPFATCCFALILSVSALDTWFAVQNEFIVNVEQNPICLMLLKMDPQTCCWFVASKVTGTILCLGLISAMLRMGYRHAGKVLVAVAMFQAGLLVYLVLSDPMMGGLPNLSLLFSETPESIWILK